MTASHDPRFVATNHKLNKLVGANVRARREDVGYSVEDLATRLEVTADTLGEWEAGVHRLPHSVLLYLTTLFSCEVIDFFEGAVADEVDIVDPDTSDQISRALRNRRR